LEKTATDGGVELGGCVGGGAPHNLVWLGGTSREALMTSNKQRSIYYGLLASAIICSLVSLFALVKMDAPGWITSLNALSLVLILLAVKIRG